MADVTALQVQLEALREAWRTGATEIAYEGKRISYRDAQGMQQAIASLEAEIARATGQGAVKQAVIRSSKGW
jgi:hypothetical protein